jgi:hypothetical protein
MLMYIADRLRPVCPDVPEDEFERLVVDVATVTLKYDRDAFANLVQRRGTQTTTSSMA